MEEKELIQLSQQGNDEAFEALVKKYQRKVFQLAFSITQDRTNADDIAQEVFLKAYIYLPKFKFKSSLGTWLYQITVNHVKDYFRKTKKIKLISLEDTQELASNKEDEMTNREKRQIENERKKLVHKALQTLPGKYKIIISLRDIQGFSYGEIVDILNISPGTVDSRLHRARKMLRKKIASLSILRGGEL